MALRIVGTSIVAGLLYLPAVSLAATGDKGPGTAHNRRPSIAGSWSVSAVVDNRHEMKHAPEVGKVIVLDDESFTDPFSSNCPHDASYPSRTISWKAAKTGFRLSRALDRYRPKGGIVADTRLACDGVPVARILFLADGRALYLAETDVYVLGRPLSDGIEHHRR